MTAPLPRRVLHAKGDIDKLNEMATNTSYDTFNYLKDIASRLVTMAADTAGKVSETITNYSSKASPVGADQAYIADSAAGNTIKRATLTSIVSLANAINATITTYSAKSPVAAADQVYIADSAAGNAIKRATLADVAAVSGNPFIDPPATANAFDDEFNSGSNDLATRGYTIKTSGGTTLTRGGDINPWDSTGPTGNTYWSRLSGSFLQLQLPVSTTVSISKSISLSAGDTYWCRVGTNNRYDSTGSANFQEVGFYQDTGGRPDQNNRVYVSHYETATSANCDMARSVAGVTAGTSRAWYTNHDLRGVRYQNGAAFYCFTADSANGQVMAAQPAGCPAAAGLVWFAIFFATPAGGNLPNIHTIDFIRKSTSNAWIAP